MCWAALIPVAIGAAQGLMQGQAQSAAAQQQARELQLNAAYLNNAAADARARGRIESDISRVQTGQFIGTQRAAAAAGGGQVDTGSNALLQQDAAQFGELDALIISNNAAREAYGYEVQAQAGLRNARTLKSNARTGMISSVLGGAVQGLGSSYSGGSLGSLFSGGASSGVNLQGQRSPLLNNSAYVSRL